MGNASPFLDVEEKTSCSGKSIEIITNLHLGIADFDVGIAFTMV